MCCLGTRGGLRWAGKCCEASVCQHGTLSNEPMVCAHGNKGTAGLLRPHCSKQQQRGSSRLSPLCSKVVCREGKLLNLASKIRGDSSPWRRCAFLLRDHLGDGLYINNHNTKVWCKAPLQTTYSIEKTVRSILANFLSNLFLNTWGNFSLWSREDI